MQIKAEPISVKAFAPYGDILECTGSPDKIINQGKCGRFHDRAQLDFGEDGRAGISVFHAEIRSLPYSLDLLERHPDGSQAFLPLDREPFLLTVADDQGGKPGIPKAFITHPGQGINFHRNVWHGVLTPIAGNGIFAVVDRIGNSPNLEEFFLDAPYIVVS